MCNEICPFECGSRRSCPSWHLHQFRWLVHRFSGNKGAGLENTRIAEMFMRWIAIWFHHCQFSLVQKSKNFSEDFLVCVFRSRKCGFSIGVLFPTIIVVRIFWNFHVEFNSKLVCRWWEGTWQGNMRVWSTSLFRDIDVKLFVLNDGLGFVIASNCIGRWSGTFVAMHGLWCDANCVASLNWLMWFVESHVLVFALVRPCSGGVWPKFNGSVGMCFFDHFVDASQYFVSPKFWWWVVFWNSILFIKIRNNHFVVPTDCFRRTGVFMHIVTVTSVWFGSWVGHDFATPRICYVGNFNFFVLRKPHISDVDVGRAEHGSAQTMNHICILSSWHCRTQWEEDLVRRSLCFVRVTSCNGQTYFEKFLLLILNR